MNCPHASGTIGTATLDGLCIGCWKERCEVAERDWFKAQADMACLEKHTNELELSNSRQGVEIIRLQAQVKVLRESLAEIAGAYANNEPISAKWAAEALAATKESQ